MQGRDVYILVSNLLNCKLHVGLLNLDMLEIASAIQVSRESLICVETASYLFQISLVHHNTFSPFPRNQSKQLLDC